MKIQTQRTRRRTRAEPCDPASLERGVRQLLADKVSGNLVGLWLLIPAHLHLGTWDLLCGWSAQPSGRVEPRLALQRVHEAALCHSGLRRHRVLSQRGFELASIVVNERFVLRVPTNLHGPRLAGAAPLLCAGITTYSPMRRWGVAKGKKVGVVGLGGLGHMGVRFARAFGAHVVVFTTSPNKTEDALRLGADEVVVSRDAKEMQKHTGSFEFILDTVSAQHDINAFINLLRHDGTITIVGATYRARSLAASPRRRKCSTSAGRKSSPRTWR